MTPRRLARRGAALVLAGCLTVLVSTIVAAGAPFPDPVVNQSVYDEADVLTPAQEAALERRIDALEARSGAEVAIFLQVDPYQDFDTNLAAAQALLEQWGVGREGFDDGLVILVSFETDRAHGVISTYAGSGFKVAYLSVDEQASLINDVMAPEFRSGDPGGGLAAAMDVIEASVTAAATNELNTYRQVNAVIGIPGAILAFVLAAGTGALIWKREGDDPDVVDSPSVLMAGPPADMTPPLATVLREGRAGSDSMKTMLVELAGTGYIRFRNLDRVGKVKRDSDPDPLNDPAIDLTDPPSDQPRPTGSLGAAYTELVSLGGSARTLQRESLWAVNHALDPVRRGLEQEAVRLGWFTRLPTPAITKWVGVGVLEAVAGGILIVIGFAIPMSGLTLVGVALMLGGTVTVAFGTQMSKRTTSGAYIDAMLKAYRRTLQKTMAQAQSMAQVIEDPVVKVLADTPDKAVIWGVALGLYAEVGEVLAREMADPQTRAAVQGSGAYYPVWLGSSGGGFGGTGGGSLFSGSGIPDVGGMLGALGSVGSTPASSSSGGGGFGGGGGGGGGGASGGF